MEWLGERGGRNGGGAGESQGRWWASSRRRGCFAVVAHCIRRRLSTLIAQCDESAVGGFR